MGNWVASLRAALHRLTGTFKASTRRHGRLAIIAAGTLAAGIVIGMMAGRMLASPRAAHQVTAVPAAAPAPTTPPAAPIAQQPAMPAPAPSADPPATETSPQTVVEDEPAAASTPQPQVASLPLEPAPSAIPSAPRGEPAWQRFALPAPHSGGRPIIAVIIDDMGLDRRRSERIMQLPGPLTISMMAYAEDAVRQAEEARAHGHELMMHVPMEPVGGGIDPGPNALITSLPPDELRRRIVENLGRFDGYVGINNHMGSKFTAFAPGMQMVMDELQRRGLLFIDSLTTDHSVGLAMAQHAGIPTAGRNVFLDNVGEVAAVNSQLAKLEELARKKGNAIAIGHPRDATIAALTAWLPTLPGKGFVLVPVTAVVRARMTTTAQASH